MHLKLISYPDKYFIILNYKSFDTSMTLRQQIVGYLSNLEQQNNTFRQKIEKYQQQIQYVCLKLSVHDWLQFLTDVRLGNIRKIYNDKAQNQNHSHNSHSLETRKANSAMSVFNQIFQNLSTQRSNPKQKYWEYESPIYSQASVKDVQGGDTSRNESQNQFIPNLEKNKQKPDINQFQTRKMTEDTPKKANQQQSIEKILKYMQRYESEKYRSLEGFDTFRKSNQISPFEKNIEEKTTNSERYDKSVSNRDTMKKNPKNLKPFLKQKQPVANNYLFIDDKTTEQDQNQQVETTDQQILAIENTKLRRKIKELQQKMRAKN